MSQPKKPVIVYSACGVQRSSMALALRTRLSTVWVASCADGVGLLQAFCFADTACLVLLRVRDPRLDRAALAVIEMLAQKLPEMRVVDVRMPGAELRACAVATQVVRGMDVAAIVHAVRVASVRKRGPKRRPVVHREEVGVMEGVR